VNRWQGPEQKPERCGLGRGVRVAYLSTGVALAIFRVSLRAWVSASWLNQVERFFAKITTQRIRRGTFENVRALETAIDDYLVHHNQRCQPFVWTATADAILDKVQRFCERTSETRH